MKIKRICLLAMGALLAPITIGCTPMLASERAKVQRPPTIVACDLSYGDRRCSRVPQSEVKRVLEGI